MESGSTTKSEPLDSRVANAEAWQGHEPADGTRRQVVRETIHGFLTDAGAVDLEKAPGGAKGLSLALADVIELSLLEAAEDAGPPA